MPAASASTAKREIARILSAHGAACGELGDVTRGEMAQRIVDFMASRDIDAEVRSRLSELVRALPPDHSAARRSAFVRALVRTNQKFPQMYRRLAE
jgi:hypothetical protein